MPERVRLEECDDRALVRLASRGEERALELLYLRHRDWAFGVAWRLTGSREDAADVLQDAFADLFQRLPGFRLTSSMRAWLYPVIKHRCVSLHRKRRRVVPLQRQEPLHWQPAASGDFERLLATLPDHQREVVAMRFAADMKLGEIAQALGVPLGTVKSRLHLALKALRRAQASSL